MAEQKTTIFEHGESELGPSRSAKKRESAAWQTVAEELAGLAPAELRALGLPPELYQAAVTLQETKSHEGRRRQTQYLGRIMRELVPEERARAEDAVARLRRQSRAGAENFHRLEELRARLLLAGEAGELAIKDILAGYPQAEEGRLRHLIAGAMAERARGKSPKNSRELFRYLRSLEDGV